VRPRETIIFKFLVCPVAGPPSAGGTVTTPGRPPLTEIVEDRRATVTDALQSTTFRLYSSVSAPVIGEAAPRHPLPRCLCDFVSVR